MDTCSTGPALRVWNTLRNEHIALLWHWGFLAIASIPATAREVRSSFASTSRSGSDRPWGRPQEETYYYYY